MDYGTSQQDFHPRFPGYFPFTAGQTFIRWGRKSCPTGATHIYKGKKYNYIQNSYTYLMEEHYKCVLLLFEHQFCLTSDSSTIIKVIRNTLGLLPGRFC